MKMKRLLAMLLVIAAIVFCFAGCKQQETTEQKSEQTEQAADQPTGEAGTPSAPATAEPVTISVLVSRHNDATIDVSSQWFFQYMEYWFAEQGYDVTIEATQATDDEQIALLLGTDSLPDLIWGPTLSTSDAVQYGLEEGMLLDWAPYIDKETMPNLTAQFETYPEVLPATTLENGAVYGIPYFKPFLYSSGTYGVVDRLFLRQSWLDKAGVEVPTTEEGLLDMLRAFKQIAPEGDLEAYPLTSADRFFEKYLWTCFGYYGSNTDFNSTAGRFGCDFAIKDEQVQMPVLTEDYDAYIAFMNTLYTEGLISPDCYTMDGTAARAMISNDTAGAFCYWTLEDVGDDYADIVMAKPVLMGSNDEIHISCLSYYEANRIWASSKTEHPELVAMLVDFIYSDEGSFLYRYGPAKGEDPLNLVSGYYYDEDGNITYDEVESGAYATCSAYGRDYLYPYDNVGLRAAVVSSGTGEIISYTDSVTGRRIDTIDTVKLTDDNNDNHWRLINIETWNPYATSVRLPACYLTPESAQEMADLKTILVDYVAAESVKFITGTRPLSELDAFKSEIITMGAEDYLATYQEAYADYMSSVFGG